MAKEDRRCLRCDRVMLPVWADSLAKSFGEIFGHETPLTWVFVLLCLLDFFGMFLPIMAKNPGDFSWLLGSGVGTVDLLRWGGLVYLPVAGPDGSLIEELTLREPWRLLSAMFVHLGGLHLAMNTLTLVSLGRAVESRLGSGRFAVLFLSTGIAGYLLSEVYYQTFPGVPGTAGASGGLFGLIGALAGYLYARRDPGWKEFLIRVAVMAIAFTIIFPVNNAAHVGGLVVGFAFGIGFYREHQPWKHNRAFAVLGGLMTVLSFASVVLCLTSPITRTMQQLRDQHANMTRLSTLAPVDRCRSGSGSSHDRRPSPRS